MSGVAGFLGRVDAPDAAIAAMAGRFAWRGEGRPTTLSGPGWALAVAGAPDTTALASSQDVHLALQGHPSWLGGAPRTTPASEVARAVLDRYCAEGDAFLPGLAGDFALALIDVRRRTVLLAVDRTGVRSLVWEPVSDGVVFGPGSAVVGAHPRSTRTLRAQSILDYVYFHMVPGPATMFEEHVRLAPGTALTWRDGRVATRAWWEPEFDEESGGSVAAFRPGFRGALEAGVRAYASGDSCGTFLSGGTDSSTVTGLLGRLQRSPPRTYSIGFAAQGYDELEYARIAAKHFGARAHEYYVTPDDVVTAVPKLAELYDQPFGNASAVPTYHCARLAREDGVTRLLGGDGGDELFGGNSRYAQQERLARYGRLPAALREGLLEPMLLGGDRVDSLPLAGKAKRYVEQARLPMPARYESWNLLTRLGARTIFTDDFLDSVDPEAPQRALEARWQNARAESLINRMLDLDFKFTLADSDLPKVTRTCDLAGVDVAFPLLHEAVLDFSLGLPPDFKLRGTRLRWFFKEALADFLPAPILAKEKHGFGLPAGLWLRDHPPLRALAADALDGIARRGVVRRPLVDSLLNERLAEHPGYYGTLVWILMMLELWFREHGAGAKTP